MLREDTWNAKITFDAQRVFIQFHQEGNPALMKKLPGRICFPVYLAIKQKQLGMNYHIHLLDRAVAERYTNQVELTARRLLNPSDDESETSSSLSNRSEVPYALQIPPPRLPELQENVIEVSVCHVEEPDHFWCHRIDRQSRREYKEIDAMTGERGRRLDRWDPAVPIHKGNLVMAPYNQVAAGSSTEYYRAKVLSVQRDMPRQDRLARLYFIDFGDAGMALVRELRVVPDSLLKIPPLAIECHLTGVGPSLVRNPKGEWDVKAKEWFQSVTVNKYLKAKVKHEIFNYRSIIDFSLFCNRSFRPSTESLRWI